MARFHSPFYPHQVIDLVPKADGKGWKEPNITDCIKHLLVVGLTSTLDVEKENLTDWKVKQGLFHAMTLPYSGGFDPESHKVNEEEYKEWENELLSRMKDGVNVYADDGSDVDREVKNYFDGKEYKLAESVLPIAEVIQTRMKELGAVRLEHSKRGFDEELWVSYDPDFLYFNAENDLVGVDDLKRKGKSTFDKCKKEGGLDPHHKLQVGGYCRNVKKLNSHGDVKLGIIVSCRETNEARLVQITDTDRWERAYYHQNRSWMLRKGFDNPQERFAVEKNKVKVFIDECLEQQKWRIQ